MAKFHVGQRVRVIVHALSASGADAYLHEGVVTSCDGSRWPYLVRLPVETLPVGGVPANEWFFRADELAPLTDPSADRFIESIKKLGREPINEAPKVTVTK